MDLVALLHELEVVLLDLGLGLRRTQQLGGCPGAACFRRAEDRTCSAKTTRPQIGGGHGEIASSANGMSIGKAVEVGCADSGQCLTVLSDH